MPSSLNAVRKLSLSLVTLFGVAAMGCSSSSGDSSESSSDTLEGRFLDDAVAGLAYSTDTLSGTTDAEGTFTYADGETVTFSVGGVELGSAAGGETLTPLHLLDMETPDLPAELITRIVFLQSLDADSDPANGIEIPDAIRTSLDGQSADFASQAAIDTLLTNLGLAAADEANALDHFQSTLETAFPPTVTMSHNAASIGCSVMLNDPLEITFSTVLDPDTFTSSTVALLKAEDLFAPTLVAPADIGIGTSDNLTFDVYDDGSSPVVTIHDRIVVVFSPAIRDANGDPVFSVPYFLIIPGNPLSCFA